MAIVTVDGADPRQDQLVKAAGTTIVLPPILPGAPSLPVRVIQGQPYVFLTDMQSNVALTNVSPTSGTFSVVASAPIGDVTLYNTVTLPVAVGDKLRMYFSAPQPPLGGDYYGVIAEAEGLLSTPTLAVNIGGTSWYADMVCTQAPTLPLSYWAGLRYKNAEAAEPVRTAFDSVGATSTLTSSTTAGFTVSAFVSADSADSTYTVVNDAEHMVRLSYTAAGVSGAASASVLSLSPAASAGSVAVADGDGYLDVTIPAGKVGQTWNARFSYANNGVVISNVKFSELGVVPLSGYSIVKVLS